MDAAAQTTESDPLVSIVIPCFNAEAYVREAIDSALAQTYARTEVIAVDDGSTDGTLEILHSYGDQIRCLTGPNAGGCAARNKGLHAADGEIIQFLDADDLLVPEKLTIQVPALLQSSANVVCSGVRVVSIETGEDLPGFDKRAGDMFRQVCFNVIQTSTALHHKTDLLQVGGFREGLPCAQEKDLHIRLACAGQTFKWVPDPLAVYRRRTDSVSDNYTRVMKQYPGIVEQALKTLEQFAQTTDGKRKTLAELLVWSGRQLWRHGDSESALANYAMARRVHKSSGLDICSLPMRLLHRTIGSREALRLRSCLGRR